MKLTYWGTGAAEGIPAAYCNCPLCSNARRMGGKDIRTRAQMLIDDCLLVDLGPDTYSHSLKYGISLVDITNILVTHSHSDHFYGEDLLFRAEPYGYGGLENPLTLHGNQKTGQLLKRVEEIYGDSDCFDRCVLFHTMQAFRSFETVNHRVTPLPTVHDSREDCFIFDITSKQDGKRMLYGNDSYFFPPQTLEYLRGKRFDLISLDCTMGGAPSCSGHMNMQLCSELAAQLREQGTADAQTNFVVTHFSHNNGLNHRELCDMAGKDGFTVTYDGLTLTI